MIAGRLPVSLAWETTGFALVGDGSAADTTRFATNGTVVDGAQAYFEGLQTVEGRLAVSGVLVLFAVIVAAWLAPRLVRWTARILERRVPENGPLRTMYATGGYVPTTVGSLVVRSIQVTVVGAAAISLLVVWGLVDWAVTIVTYVGLSLPAIVQVGVTVIVLLLAYVGLEVLDDAVDRFGEGADRVTDHQEEIIRRMGHLGILALTVATAMSIWGVDLSGLLVGAGFLGIVVGLAARQTLGSLIAGFVLMFSRPFTIGDWVVVGEEEGIVTDITIMNTRLENFDGEFVVIPNDRVANSAITNRSRKGHLRIRIDVGIDYDADPDRAEDVALEAMESVDVVSSAPQPQVIPKDFGDSAIVLELRFWIDRPTPPRKWQATAGVVSAVNEAFAREDIKIPFPQRELSGRAETGSFHVHGDVAREDSAASGVAGPSTDGGDDD